MSELILKCPCCSKELVNTHSDRYEQIDEHVSGSYVTMKAGYQCIDEYCIANNLQATWTSDGEIFIDPPEEIKWSVAHDMITKSSITGDLHAIGSWYSKYAKMNREKKNGTVDVKIMNYKLEFLPRHVFDDKKDDYRKLFLPKLTIWKRSLEFSMNTNSYVYVVPFYSTVEFLLKKFTRKSDSVQHYIDDFSRIPSFDNDAIIKSMQIAKGLNDNNKPARTLASLLTVIIIRVFFYKKYRMIKTIHDRNSANLANS